MTKKIKRNTNIAIAGMILMTLIDTTDATAAHQVTSDTTNVGGLTVGTLEKIATVESTTEDIVTRETATIESALKGTTERRVETTDKKVWVQT